MSSQRWSGSWVCWAPSISTAILRSSQAASIQRLRPRRSRRADWRLGSGSPNGRTTRRRKSSSEMACEPPAMSPRAWMISWRRRRFSIRWATSARSATLARRCCTPAERIAAAPRSVGIQAAASMSDRAIRVRLGCRVGCTSASAEKLGVVRDNGQPKWRRMALVADGHKEVDGRFAHRTLVVESLKTIQSRRRQTGQGRPRTRPEQRDAQQLPVSERSGLSDDNATGRFLPAAGRYPPAQLAFGHKSKRQGHAEDALVISKHFVEAKPTQIHILSVRSR